MYTSINYALLLLFYLRIYEMVICFIFFMNLELRIFGCSSTKVFLLMRIEKSVYY